MRFRLTAYTDPAGKWDDSAPNKGNEDNLFVDTNLSDDTQGAFVSDREEVLSKYGTIMVVADGMGGMNAGEVASAIAIDVVKRSFKRDVLSPEIVSSSGARERYMERVVSEADIAIKSEGARRAGCEGMGSTIILAWLCGGELSVTWCGDSRVYLYRELEGLHQVSKDHSYVQALIDSGQITREEAFDHPYGNIITRSLGDPEKRAKGDSVTLPVLKGDIILVCSDGLSGVLRDRRCFDRMGIPYPGENMEDIIRANSFSMVGCREALWKAAESAGWYDNVTAILCEITDDSTDEPSVETSSGDSLSKSRINFSIHKKMLYRLITALIILLILLGLFFYLRNRRGIHVLDFLPSFSNTTAVSDEEGRDELTPMDCEQGNGEFGLPPAAEVESDNDVPLATDIEEQSTDGSTTEYEESGDEGPNEYGPDPRYY